MFEDPAMNEFFGEVKQEPTAKRRRPEESNKENNKFGSQRGKGGKTEELVHYFSSARVQAGGGASGPKAGPLIHAVHATRQGHGADVSVSDGHSVQEETGGIPHLGGGLSASTSGTIPGPLQRTGHAHREAVEKDDNKIKEIIDLGTQDFKWKFQFQVWNPTLRHLQEDKSRPPPTTADIKQMLEKLYAAIRTDIVTRFCCTRKLTETMESQATFYFDLSCRNQGQAAWETMTQVLRATADRVGVQKGGTAPGTHGSETSRTSQCALRLALGNLSQNACYMNSFVQVLLWSLAMTSENTTSLGSSAHFFRQLHNQDFSIVKHLRTSFGGHSLQAGPTVNNNRMWWSSHDSSARSTKSFLWQENGKPGPMFMGWGSRVMRG